MAGAASATGVSIRGLLLLAIPVAMIGLGVYEIYQVFTQGDVKTRVWRASAETGDGVYASCVFVATDGSEDPKAGTRMICE